MTYLVQKLWGKISNRVWNLDHNIAQIATLWLFAHMKLVEEIDKHSWDVCNLSLWQILSYSVYFYLFSMTKYTHTFILICLQCQNVHTPSMQNADGPCHSLKSTNSLNVNHQSIVTPWQHFSFNKLALTFICCYSVFIVPGIKGK